MSRKKRETATTTLPYFRGGPSMSYIAVIPRRFYAVLVHSITSLNGRPGGGRRRPRVCCRAVEVTKLRSGSVHLEADSGACPYCELAASGSDLVWRHRLEYVTYLAVLARRRRGGQALTRVQTLRLWWHGEETRNQLDRLKRISYMETPLVVEPKNHPRGHADVHLHTGKGVKVGKALREMYEVHRRLETLENAAEPTSPEDAAQEVRRLLRFEESLAELGGPGCEYFEARPGKA